MRESDYAGSFIWYAGVDKSHTLVLPRPLPTGPSPADLYIPSDAPPLGPPPNANEGDANEEPYEEPTEMEYEPVMQVETFHPQMSYGGGASSSHGGYHGESYDGFPSHGYFESAFRQITERQDATDRQIAENHNILMEQQRKNHEEIMAQFNAWAPFGWQTQFPPPH